MVMDDLLPDSQRIPKMAWFSSFLFEHMQEKRHEFRVSQHVHLDGTELRIDLFFLANTTKLIHVRCRAKNQELLVLALKSATHVWINKW